MKKLLILAVLAFFATTAFSQANLFSAGVCHTAAAPNFNPGLKGCRLVLDTTSQTFYVWKIGTVWVALGRGVDEISGCSAPAYTPTKWQSSVVINKCTPNPELYYYFAGTWKLAGGAGGGATYTAGTGINISAGNVISNTGDLSNTNEIQNLSLAGQALSISGGTGVTLPVVGATAADFDIASGVLSLDYTNAQKATAVVPGFLTAADFAAFNAKDPSSTNEIQALSIAGQNLTLSLGGGTVVIPGASSNTVTEKKTYYREEQYVDRAISTATGATSADVTKSTTDYLPITGSESVTIYTANASNFTCYGWAYDATLTAISEIRAAGLIGTAVTTFTFTTPSNARYIQVYTEYGGVDFSKLLKIESTTAITYNTPITPEQFTGTTSDKIQAALDFARFTTSAVHLRGYYEISKAIILNSGNRLVLDNARVRMESGMHDNMIRNEAVADPTFHIFNRGNRDIKIIGLGQATFEGSDEQWGGDDPSGVGSQRWRSIGFLLANVEVFEVAGLSMKNTKSWGMCFEQSRVGTIKNISYQQNGALGNQDGINIRRGSNRVTIENIRGHTQDDMVALTNLEIAATINILGSTIYEPGAANLDIHSIVVKNIQRKPIGEIGSFNPPVYKGGILLLCEDGLKIHDVTIDGVTGTQQINVGFSSIAYWVTTQATVNDMYNISISNTGEAPVYTNRPVKNCSFINIPRVGPTGYASAGFQAGTINTARKYHDGDYEFYGPSGTLVVPGVAIGDNITSATAGSVFFAGTAGVLAQDNANFNFVNADDFLGIGLNPPLTALHIKKNFVPTYGQMALDNPTVGLHFTWLSFMNNGVRDGWFGYNGGIITLSGGTGVPLTFFTNDTEKARIQTTGQLKLNSYGANTFTGTAAKYLAVESDGDLIEVAVPVATPPAGSNKQVQFNDSGAFGGDVGFTYDKTVKQLAILNSNSDPATPMIKISTDQSTGYGYMMEMLSPNLPNGNEAFFYLGKSTTGGEAGFFSFIKNATPSLNRFYYGINGNFFHMLANGFTGLGISAPLYRLDIAGTGAIRIPSGTTAEGPTGAVGVIRHNTTVGGFRGVRAGTTYETFLMEGDAWGTRGNVAIAGTQFLGSTNNVSLRFRTNNVQRMIVDSIGNVGIGQNTPTAVLHIKAGSATANTAPVKLTSGPLLTVSEPGAVGYNNSLYFTKNSGLRFGIGGIIFKSSTTVPNVTTTETDLYSHTLPASALATENESVEAAFSVSTLGSATATTQNRLYFGGTLIYDSGAIGFSIASDFRYTVEIIRESATVVKVSVTGATTTATAAPYVVYTRITGLTLTNTQVLRITGTRAGVGSASGDINGQMSAVKWFPAAG